MEPMRNFAGLIEYLTSWTWVGEQIIQACEGVRFFLQALPLYVPERGEAQRFPHQGVPGEAVFRVDDRSDAAEKAFEYLLRLAVLDLQYRGFRDERIASFEWKQNANFLLFRKVCKYEDQHEYELYRQRWEICNRPAYNEKTYGEGQSKALSRIAEALKCEDENLREMERDKRWLYIAGKPGSGKSEVIKEGAIRAAKKGFGVLLVCPTG